MTPEEALALLLDRRDEAEEAKVDAARVEAAFKLEAQKAQRAFIQASQEAPRSAATAALDGAYRAAVRQWAKAQADAERAYRAYAAISSKVSRRGQERVQAAQRVRNGSRVHPRPVRPLEGQHGLPA